MRISRRPHWSRALKGDERGAAAVEFALLLPVISMLFFGIVTFGFLFNIYISVTHAAREGARWAALGASSSEVSAKAAAAAPTLDWASATVSLTGVPSSGAAIGDQGNPVTVTVSYPLPAYVVSLGGSLSAISQVISGSPPPSFPTALGAHATQRVE